MTPVAVLFARADSVYKTMPGCDVYDMQRDARTWPGGAPVVAHPDCGPWARLRHFCKLPQERKDLAPLAVDIVRRWGGVLEHPAGSLLWPHCGMPAPGRAPDRWGGWTARIRQCDFGHRAEKVTDLYIVGCHPDDLPPMPPPGEPTAYIKSNRKGYRPSARSMPHVTHAERENTPPDLAVWLVEVARRCARQALASAA